MIKKALWTTLGFLSLGMAYIGVVTPGIPYSPFVVFAAYCFSKGSERMHRWIYNHKIFGPFLTNWGEKRVFPLKLKFLMLGMMSLSLVLMNLKIPSQGTLWFVLHKSTTIIPGFYSLMVPGKPVIYTAIFMACVAIWAWRFPSSVEEYDRRIANGKKIGWFNNSF